MSNAAASAAPASRSHTASIWVIAGICAVSICLWLGFLWHSGENYQEQYNVQLVAGPQHGLSAYGSPDDPMPLYYLALDGFAHLTQPTLAYGRLLSLICMVLAIIVTYAVGTRMSGDQRVGRVGAALIGLSPFVLWYGSRATMYALLLLLTLINQYFFTALLQHPRWWHWTGYLLSGLVGLGVHFFFVLIILLQAVFVIVKYRDYGGKKYLGMAACFAGLLAVFCLWVGLYGVPHTTFWHSLPYTARPSATNAFIIYVQYLFGFQSVVVTTLIIAFWPLLVILALLAVQKYVRPPVGVQYALWAATAPMFTVFVLGWIMKPLFLTSYLIVSAAPFMLFLSWYFVAFGLRSLLLARNILLAAMVAAFFVQIANQPLALQEDYLGQPSPTPTKLLTLPGT